MFASLLPPLPPAFPLLGVKKLCSRAKLSMALSSRISLLKLMGKYDYFLKFSTFSLLSLLIPLGSPGMDHLCLKNVHKKLFIKRINFLLFHCLNISDQLE
jgi:hypothetical protein